MYNYNAWQRMLGDLVSGLQCWGWSMGLGMGDDFLSFLVYTIYHDYLLPKACD